MQESRRRVVSLSLSLSLDRGKHSTHSVEEERNLLVMAESSVGQLLPFNSLGKVDQSAREEIIEGNEEGWKVGMGRFT